MTEEQDTTKVPTSLAERSDGPVSREALYEIVWSEPMLEVAARFGVSSSYMARACTLLNVPRPGRIPAIVQELEKATVEIARLVEEGERQA